MCHCIRSKAFTKPSSETYTEPFSILFAIRSIYVDVSNFIKIRLLDCTEGGRTEKIDLKSDSKSNGVIKPKSVLRFS